MKRYILLILVSGLFVLPAYCQDNQSSADQNQAPAAPAAVQPAQAPAPEKVVQAQEISIYGEVKSSNPAANSVTVQYYDYDSDEERSIDIMIDNNTKMENAAAVNDIKQGNWADVIYSIADGKNIAKSIIVEKEEEAPEMPKAEEKPAASPPTQY
ncbi:MAG: hypothetical protein Q7S07_05595 [Candidatus Omnitrophota bacterium]|nr:hypothetical protein [Candidatus Omnitrophota bacterium]